MNLYMIAKSNIKKNKNMSLTLVILIIFATILLYIGSSVIIEMNNFLDEKNSKMNGSDFTVLAPQLYKETVQKIVEDMGGYEQLEMLDVLTFSAVFQNETQHGKSQSMDCLMLNADNTETISKLNIIDESENKLTNSIILPYYLKIAEGYKAGDEITITFEGKPHTYIIYGFAEDIMFATPSNVPCYKSYIFEEEFNNLYQKAENTQFFLLKTRLVKGTDSSLFSDIFVKQSNERIASTNTIMSLDYAGIKIGVSVFFIILMAILIAFSVIIILIALTVMRFAIVTYIEGNIKNIGSMEALGYTGKELVIGTVLQFALITLVSVGLGLVIAISSTGIVTNLASSSIGLVWNSKVNPLAIILSIIVIMTSVILITYLTSAKLKKITPIVALRSGIDTHNFKKNHFPFSKGTLNIHVAIGLKSLMHNWKQNITILIIVTLMSFVSVFAFTANYNFNIDNTAFLRLIGLEKSQLLIRYQGEDALKVFDEIGQMKNIKKTVRLTGVSMTTYMGNKEITPVVNVCNDFNLLEIKTIIKGRYPIHDNEVAVTGLVLKRLNAELGDAISIGNADAKQEFIIVGVTQQISYLGKGACITEDGMKRINPDFIPSELYLYIDSSNVLTVKKVIEEKYSNLQLYISNVEETLDTTLDSFNKAVIGLCIVCIIITICIISLILYLLIKIKLMKDRIRIGVAKALGYTTRPLILQIIVSFCPISTLGALLGTILAMFLINPLFAAMLSVSGSIQNSNLIINPMLTMISFLTISLYSVLITALVAGAVKKITPCELFN